MSSAYSISDPMDPFDSSPPIGSPKSLGSSPDCEPAAGRPTVLIVDDVAMNRKLLRLFLESAQFNVLDAADGVEALEILESHPGPIDVIISDILMPKMDGYQLCNRIRKHPKFNQLPFILYSSTFESPSNDQLCLAVGVSRFLAKPAPPEEIVRALTEVLRKPKPPAANWVPANDTAVLKEYNQALVRKLEEKNHELKETVAHLNQAKLDLHTYNLELEERVRERTEELIALNQKVTLLNATLEERVLDRTSELQAANRELESFAYSVSHDLRAPLRGIDGFARMLLEDYGSVLDAEGKRLIGVVCGEAKRMGKLVDELLSFSRLARQETRRLDCDMTLLARCAFEQIPAQTRGHIQSLKINPLPWVRVDSSMIRLVWTHLLTNAVKFTAHQPAASIEVGALAEDGFHCFFVKDNGAGFDPRYKHKLFCVFQRLHSEAEFEGTGVGLALVHRIITRHGGTMRAEGKPGHGATFFFTLSAAALSNAEPSLPLFSAISNEP